MIQRLRLLYVPLLGLTLFLTLSLTTAAQRVTLKFLWPEYTPAKVRFGEGLVEQFKEAYPDIDIEMMLTNNPSQSLTVLSAAGTPPDVGWMGAGWKGIKDLWLPLDAFIERDAAELNIDDFIAPVWGSYRVDNKHYALPLGFTATVMYHNLDHAAAAGLSPPDQDWTWTDFVDRARKQTVQRGNDVVQYGLNLYHGGDHMPLLYYDGAFWNADATQSRFNTPARIFMIEERRNLEYVYNVQALPAWINANGGHQPSFLNGLVSMYAGGSWALEPVRQAVTFSWDITPFPIAYIDGQAYRGTGIWPEEMYISAQTDHPEEAWKFIKFATSERFLRWAAREGHIIPSRLSVGASDDFLAANEHPQHIDAFIRSGEMGTVYMDHPLGNEIAARINPILNQAMRDQQNPIPAQSAALEIDRIIQAILDEYNAQQR